MSRRLFTLVAGALAAASLLGAADARAQEPNQVFGLTAEHRHGYTTLAWNTVPGATDYQIERTPVNADGEPTGAGTIVGLWRPNRTVTPDFPTFADAGFNPGASFQWRVRARFGTTNQPYSAPVAGTTSPRWGDPSLPGESLRTQWEQTNAAQFTSDVNEYAYTAALDAASDRVRVVEIGRTLLNRPINMFVIGYPAPPATADEVAAGPSAIVNCNVHGNEPSSREACLIMARELAFATDARTLDILSNMTVLLVPTINGDGRAANQRGNATGQDLNRDYSLLRQPETFSFVRMLTDYKPKASFDGHEFGNNNAGDLPVLPPRHLNVAQPIFDKSLEMIEDHLYVRGSVDGWWYCPYGCQGGGSVGLSEETILRNTLGLKNVVASLLEARSAGGPTRPAEGAAAANRQRKTYSALYTYHEFLDYYRAEIPAIAQAIDEAVAFQVSNTGRIVFRGSRPIPAHPAPHPGEAPPPQQNPTAAEILEEPPCGYLLNEAQWSGPRSDSPAGFPTTVADRVAAHGWAVDTRPAGYIVRLAQPERGLIPLLLDGQAAEPLVSGARLYACPHATAAPETIGASATEGTATSVSLTVGNVAVEPDESLEWTLEEAADDCSSTSDLDWLDANPASGTTASRSASVVSVTLSAAAVRAPATRSGLLCLVSNDPGEPVISIPVALQATYPFAGFLPPVRAGLNDAGAGSTVPVKFALGGERESAFFAAGSPSSQRVDCETGAVLGEAQPIRAPGSSGLQYDPATGTYSVNWKTATSWAGTCRALTVALDDGTSHTAAFRFH